MFNSSDSPVCDKNLVIVVTAVAPKGRFTKICFLQNFPWSSMISNVSLNFQYELSFARNRCHEMAQLHWYML